MKETELTEKQQLLLNTYFDNECSCISRFLAERLIKTNSAAQRFVQNLNNTSESYRAFTSSQDVSANLWDRISNRIEAEERAALYLGKRAVIAQDNEGSLISRFFSRQAFVGGLSGAAIAGLVLVLISRPSKPGEIIPVYAGRSAVAHNTSAFHQASLGADQTSYAGRSTMEVDWMRANGSLKIIQNPTDKSGIIWVRKRSGRPILKQQGLNPTPTIRAQREAGFDVQPLGTAK